MTKRRKTEPIDDFTVSDSVNNIVGCRIRFKAKNVAQKDFSRLITDKEITIAAGPSGTGKSYTSIARALELLQNKTNKFDKILIYKPAIEVEEKHGYLPGSIDEKIGPYVESSLAIIDKIIGKNARQRLMAEEIIEVKALAYIRGANIDNSILIMEEAQNMSPNQMKTLLSRIGENSKFIISGDMDQSDRYNDTKKSGLYDAINRLKKIEEIGFFEFKTEDIVRNPIISKILNLYKAPKEEDNSPKEEKNKRVTPSVSKHERIQLHEGISVKTNNDSPKKKWKILISKYFKW